MLNILQDLPQDFRLVDTGDHGRGPNLCHFAKLYTTQVNTTIEGSPQKLTGEAVNWIVYKRLSPPPTRQT